jgi:hypothetical protein
MSLFLFVCVVFAGTWQSKQDILMAMAMVQVAKKSFGGDTKRAYAEITHKEYTELVASTTVEAKAQHLAEVEAHNAFLQANPGSSPPSSSTGGSAGGSAKLRYAADDDALEMVRKGKKIIELWQKNTSWNKAWGDEPVSCVCGVLLWTVLVSGWLILFALLRFPPSGSSRGS